MTPFTQPLAGRRAALPPTRRLMSRIMGIVESRLFDRLIAGRLWIPLIAAALIGIVVIHVAALGINADISRSVEQAAVLEQRNAVLASEISWLESGERLGDEVEQMGMVDPVVGSQRYVQANQSSASDAVRALATIAARGPDTQATAQAASVAALADGQSTADPGAGTPAAGAEQTPPPPTAAAQATEAAAPAQVAGQ